MEQHNDWKICAIINFVLGIVLICKWAYTGAGFGTVFIAAVNLACALALCYDIGSSGKGDGSDGD